MRPRRCLSLALILSLPSFARAQRPEAPASTASPEVRAWISGGAGSGTYAYGSGTGFRLSAGGSYGQTLLMYRGSTAMESLDGYGDSTEWSILVGRRTAGSRFYGSAAVGLSRVHWTNGCPTISVCEDGAGTGIAYDFGVHPNARVVGLGVNLYGVLGSTKARMTGVALSLELGWFGR
jgi:hypothetical protein